MPKSISPIFLLEFKLYIQGFNPCWVDLCAWYKMRILFHYFACDCPVFPTPFIEETVVSFPRCFLSFKLIHYVCMVLFPLFLLFYFTDPCVCLYSNTVLFWLLRSDQIRSVAQSCPTLWTPWIPAWQASLSITNSRSSLRLTFIESVMPSSHLILCRPLLLLPPVPPSIRVLSNESTLPMR